MSDKYFVFINGLRGPEGQILNELPTDGNGKFSQQTLFQAKLTPDEEKLSLDELILKFKDKVDGP